MDTNIITPEGYAELEQELDYLWRTERPEVTKKVTWAASLGDRSENADYQYNKKRLREIDRRVRYLRKRLDAVRVSEYHPSQEGKAYFGAWVTLMDEEDNTLLFRIVGPDEIYGKKHYASVNAPVVRACLGKSVGDDVFIKTEEATREWEITAIRYDTPL
ncbi:MULTISPECIES: transcription elongation factor GreB [unclassified Oceanobacter]|jgi:transcription elongation factor GreB|uniref:transcription elongation factor GreB n=1 Tax=unclassified Oceanobacter TaxID=2620260 RepID=UPI0026E34F7E|nr:MULTISPECIES: transcription elongation factor GreB [unclassified Oceanobacter]MDO6683233.1 transcription elongation factor GreB [Oceanobacter sp. 5_MG-2023]MDP2547291.1 transcription elongation factor GreB [Oceanobacter sp. 4_MG-2023]